MLQPDTLSIGLFYVIIFLQFSCFWNRMKNAGH